jgi:hypothetical protein
MPDQIRSNAVWESDNTRPVQAFETGYQFRFVPDSYLAAIGTELDTGLDLLVYLRSFVEDETEDELG